MKEESTLVFFDILGEPLIEYNSWKTSRTPYFFDKKYAKKKKNLKKKKKREKNTKHQNDS